MNWRTLRRAALLACAIPLALLLAVATLLRFVVWPHLPHYADTVERIAGEALGRAVTVESLAGDWQGLEPRIVLSGLRLVNQHGEVALVLPRVEATLSWRSLPTASLRLRSLLVSGAELDIERDADGDLFVGGIFIDRHKKGDGSGLDWLLQQDRIEVRDSRLRWRDASRGAPELQLDDLDLLLENAWLDHRFSLHAAPPASLAAPLDFNVSFQHSPFASRLFDPAAWTGSLKLQWRDADLAAWGQWVDYGLRLEQGQGSLGIAARFAEGSVEKLEADLGLRGVAVQLDAGLPLLRLDRVQGQLTASTGKAGGAWGWRQRPAHRLSLRNFSLQTADGIRLDKLALEQEYQPAAGGAPEQTRVSASELDLGALARLAAALPLRAPQRELLADLKPSGRLRHMQAQWEGAYPHLAGWSVKGEFDKLGIAPARWPFAAGGEQAIPGFSGLSGRIDANDKGGQLQLDSSMASLTLPGVLDKPQLGFEQLQGELQWKLREGLELTLRQARFRQEGVAGRLELAHRQAKGDARPHTELALHLDALPLHALPRYLPSSVPEGMRHAASGMLDAGVLRDVDLSFKGDLARLGQAGTQTRLSARLADGRLVLPALAGGDTRLPPVAAINGRLSLEQARLALHVEQARLGALQLTAADFIIPDLLAQKRQVDMRLEAGGPLREALLLAAATPLGRWLPGLRASGDIGLSLAAQVPIADPHAMRIKGSFRLAGNDLQLGANLPPLLQSVGELRFSESGFSLAGLRSRFLGAPVEFSGGTEADGSISLRADGLLSAEGLRNEKQLAALAPLASRLRGETRYSLQLKSQDGQSSLALESSLHGLAVDLPAPLSKQGNASLPLVLRVAHRAAQGRQAAQLDLQASAGSLLDAAWQFQSGAQGTDWKRIRGGIGVNAPLPAPDSGVAFNINLGRVDADAWRTALAQLTRGEARAPAGASDHSGSSGSSGGGMPPLAALLMPDSVTIRTPELLLGGRRLRNIVLGASAQPDGWQANLLSDEAVGHVRFITHGAADGGLRLQGHFARLDIPDGGASGWTAGGQAGPSSPVPLPSLDIVAEQFRLPSRDLGRVEIRAERIGDGAAPRWQLQKLAVINPDGQLQASGSVQAGGEGRSALDFSLSVADGGKLLARMGQPGLVADTRGSVRGQLGWRGALASPDLGSMAGWVEIALEDGRFLKIDPGAGRLLGLLSMQSLPRLMSLDFDDVLSPGFHFDSATGRADIAGGVIRSDNLKMRGTAVAIAMDGHADIVREQQDLHVLILPQFDAGNASLAVGMLVNPVIGLSTLIGQMLLREPMMAALSREYRITGPWKSPSIRRTGQGADANANAGPQAAQQ